MSKSNKKQNPVANTNPIESRRTAPAEIKKTGSIATGTMSGFSKWFGGHNHELIFNRENYKWMAIGFGLLMLGMLLMMGGGMPDANTWDPSIIYSPMRITVAPILMIAGLIVTIYAIFKK
jgi:hypothetical protein